MKRLLSAIAPGLLALALAAPAAHAAAGDIYTAAGSGVNGIAGDGGAATAAELRAPGGIAVAPTGQIYIADPIAATVRRIETDGTITRIAGVPNQAGFTGDGGPATSARLNGPHDVAVTSTGVVYIADRYNARIRRVALDGTITTWAGTGSSGLTGDNGPATSAQLDDPVGLEIDPEDDDLYVADMGNDTIRKITPAGVIARRAGNGESGTTGDGGWAIFARLNDPVDLTLDRNGNFYIALQGGNKVRRVSDFFDIITTFAGTGTTASNGDGGAATSAALYSPTGVAADSAGNIFISERGGHVIRRVTAGTITRVAGTRTSGFLGDGGAATSARVTDPERLALGATGDLYIADSGNSRIRRVQELGAPYAPTVSSTSPTSPGNANSVAVRGSAASGSTVRIYTNSTCTSAVAASGTAADFAAGGISVTVGSDSSTTFRATATNGAGATSACSDTSVTYVEDSTPPAAPAFTVEPPSPASETSPSWEFTADAGTTVECRLDRGVTGIDGWSSCASPKSYNLGAQLDGVYTITVRSTDAAGNATTATSNYTLDRGVPPIPTISSGPAATGSGRSPSWQFAGGVGDTMECRLVGGTLPGTWEDCTSPKGYSLTGQADGDYTFSVRARSVGGVRSAARTDDYRLDTASPAAPSIGTAPAAHGSGRSVSWSFTGEAGASFECRLVGGTLPGTWAGCSSPDTYSLTGQPDGDYTFSVRAKDAALNTGAATDSVYDLDTTAPAAPNAGNQPSSPSNGRTPSWGFSGAANEIFQCRLERQGELIADWVACSSPYPVDLTGRPDGVYTLRVAAVDLALNVGPDRAMTYELDTQPGALEFTAVPPVVGSTRTPQWSFGGEPGAGFDCRLLRDGEPLGDWTACASPHSVALLMLPDGRYTLEVRATDRAGNTGNVTGADYVLDTVAPAAAALAGDPGPVGRSRSVAWTFAGDSGSGFECRVERAGDPVSDWSSCVSPFEFALADQPDGTYRFLVRAFDAAGNYAEPAAHEYELDTTDPTPPAIRSGPGERGDDVTPTWTFAAERGTDAECRLEDREDVVSKWAPCRTPHTYNLIAEGDAKYTFGVRATDAAGNTGRARTDDYELATRTAAERAADREESGPGADAPATAAPTDVGAPAAPAPAKTPSAEAPGDKKQQDDEDAAADGGPASAVPLQGPRGSRAAGSDAASGDVDSGGNGRSDKKEDRAPAAVVTKALGKAVKAVAKHADKSVFPMSLVFIVGIFLLIQGRIDRNDPKLALAPVFADPEIEFIPPPTLQ